MKKLAVLLAILAICSELFSQNYFKFPRSGAIWNYKIVGSLCYPYEWPVIDSLGQEITIGSNKYVEVYKAALGNSGVIGAIREDTLQKKVYFHNFIDEIVLYDFNLEVGDTIFYTTNLYYTLNYYKVVDAVDSTLVGEQFRKTWFLTNSDLGLADVWIEGIGSVYRYGLLYPNDPDILLDASNPYFGCFAHNAITYTDSNNCSLNCPCTHWLIEIEEFDEKNNGFRVFPNPAQDALTFEYFGAKSEYDYLELFSNNAKLIYQQKIKSGVTEIDLKTVKAGIYFLKLTGANKTALRKIIKK